MTVALNNKTPSASRRIATTTVLAAIIAVGSACSASAASDVHLTIRNQDFTPKTLTIPAGQTVKIMVKNEDALPAEFESSDFNREKVIPGGTQLPVYVGPLTPGTYGFFNDFHPQSTGKLIVKPTKR
jgi:plastocyanin